MKKQPYPNTLLSVSAWKGQNNTDNERMARRRLSLAVQFSERQAGTNQTKTQTNYARNVEQRELL